MTDRDRLIELLDKTFAEQYKKRGLLTAPHTADHLLANGVICPPCKVGAIVYLFYPVRKGIYEAVVDEICLMEKSNFIVTRDLYFNRRQSIFFEQIGKTVFLTKEEAEEKLKELEK